MSSRSENARRLTRQQVLNWRGEKWSYTDKVFLKQALGILPEAGVEFIESPDGSRVDAWIANTRVFAIRPGFVYWPKGAWVADVDGSLIPGGLLVGREGDGTLWAKLSTSASGPGAKKAARDFGICETCHMALPAIGVCDDC